MADKIDYEIPAPSILNQTWASRLSSLRFSLLVCADEIIYLRLLGEGLACGRCYL